MIHDFIDVKAPLTPPALTYNYAAKAPNLATDKMPPSNIVKPTMLDTPVMFSSSLAQNSPGTESDSDFSVFPVGLNVGFRNVSQSILVRGKENGTEAVDFVNWLVPYESVINALNLDSKVFPDGRVELRSAFIVTIIELNQLRKDPKLGLAFSIKQIEELLQVKAKFDLRQYAIVFEIPEVSQENTTETSKKPVAISGLPLINPSAATFSMVEQRVNLNRTGNSNLNNSGNLTAVGTVFDSSWFINVSQSDLTNNRTWQLSEAQIVKRTPYSDYFLGSQPTFWRSQSQGDLWGFSTIQRQGYTPLTNFSGGGLNFTTRLQPDRVASSITGYATPGTLVRLTQGTSNGRVIAEQVVDSSGTYRFNNISTGGDFGTLYRVLLYPQGLLTAQPIVEDARFLTLPEQLSPGTSALVVSAGWKRQVTANNLFGSLTDFTGGVVQRWGLSESFTVGVGGVYDAGARGLAELYWQPKGFPLKVGVSALTGNRWDINTNIILDRLPNFYASFSSNRSSSNYTFDWQFLPQFRFVLNGDLARGTDYGIRFNYGVGNSVTLLGIDLKKNNQVVWNVYQQLDNFFLNHRKAENGTNSQLSYRLTPNDYLELSYDTLSTNRSDNLLTANWHYISPTFVYGQPLWDTQIGYSVGSRGSGLYAAVGTGILPGLYVQSSYRGVSLLSGESSFQVQLASSLGLQRGISPGNRYLDYLRTEGGLLIQPFFDRNTNGKLDRNEEIYTDSSDFLILNNEPVKRGQIESQKDRFLLRLKPGIYRLDLEQAGFPPDAQPITTSFAIKTVEGSYTPVLIPLQPSYIVSGVVIDAAGKPVEGATIEATSTTGGKSAISVTNGAGVYYLEQLIPGTYILKINGTPVQPNSLKIDASSEPVQELNLKLPNNPPAQPNSP